jgi:hypothetical protein
MMLALEARLMFDGAAVDTALHAADVSDAAAAKPVEAPPVPPAVEVAPAQQRTEIIFIESNITNYQTLLNGINPGAEIHVLDAAKDGLAQITQILNGRSGIDAIHILSHGSEAAVGLGSVALTANNLQDHGAELAIIGSALAADGDILIYGCNVGAGSNGTAFVSTLASLSGADIAASNDLTGAASKGGDWQLEVTSGQIESVAIQSLAYQGTLAPTATINVDDAALKIGDTPTVTIAFTGGPVTNFDNSDLTFSNGTLTDVATTDGGVTWTATFTPSAGINSSGNIIYMNNAAVTAGGTTSNVTAISNAFTIDTTAPTVTNFTLTDSTPGDNTLKITDTATVTITFSEAVSGFNSDDDVTEQNGTLSLMTSSDNKTWTGTFTPTTSINDQTNVISLASSYTDTAGNTGTTANSLNYTIDTLAPTVSSIVRANTDNTNATSVNYTVTFAESVTGVGTGDFTLTTTSGNAAGTIASISGSGTTYTVTVNSITGTGTLQLDLNAAATGITDAATNDIATGFTAGQTYTIDNTAPIVNSINRVSSEFTNATSVNYTVTFAEAVTGGSIGDFTLTTTSGNAAGTIASISGSGATRTVTVNGITGDGTLRLDLKSSGTGIADLATNAIATGFSAGQTYTIDSTLPVVTAAQSFNYAENQAANAVVGTALATDAVGVTGFRFSATGTTTSADTYFSIAANGDISITAAGVVAGVAQNDFETGLNSFTYGIEAGDAVGNWSPAVNVTLNVTDVDDNTPAITSNGGGATAAINVAENGTAVMTVTATDADLPGDTLTYSISGGADSAKFAIDPNTGVLTFVAAPNFDSPTDVGTDNIYDVIVQVSDGSLTDTQAIAVTVTAVNTSPTPVTSPQPPTDTPFAPLPTSTSTTAQILLPPADSSQTASSLLIQPSSFTATTLSLTGINIFTSGTTTTDTSTTANTFPTVVVQSDQPGPILFKGVPDQTVNTSSGLVSFTIPADAFAQSSSGTGIQLAAAQADGKPLPPWLKFDAATGQFVGTPPPGLEGTLSIKVLAKDAAGRQVSSVFRIGLGSKTTEKATPEKLPPGPNGALDNLDPNAMQLADGKPVNAGRTSLSEQIRLASRQPTAGDRLPPSRRTA